MTGAVKLLTAGSGGINLQPASSIASDVTVNVPSQNCTLGIQGPAFSAYANVDQSITLNTWTKITFQVENFDTNNNFASSRFTPTIAGYYQINFNCNMASVVGTQFMFVSIYKNGATYTRGNTAQPVNATTYASATSSSLVYLNGATDYIEGYVYFSATNSTANGADSVSISGSMVRAA